MARSKGNIGKELYNLRQKKRNLKERISQSMGDTGPHGVTGKCKGLQQELSRVVKKEKRKKQKMRRRYF
ncbi:MAG TPA: hypothetical protein DEA27_01105 [Candidatus Moranbacteria bacterium]|nr:hypothetical protein [Candidatus Moranbacteria bacterium]